MRHLLSIRDLGVADLIKILALSEGAAHRVLEGKGVALYFEKPSSRTRNSMELAAAQLGGHPVYLQPAELGIGERETVADIAHTLACYHAIIAARVFDHALLEQLAAVNAAPVLNMLSSSDHPLQAFADLLTIKQLLGRLEGVKVAYIGEGNNVSRSLAEGCALVGAEFSIASPEGYGLENLPGVRQVIDPAEAVEGADIVYSDVWVSMGGERQRRAARRIRTVPGRRSADGEGRGRVVPALPPRSSRRGSDGAGDRRSALGGLAPGREQDAHGARRHALDVGKGSMTKKKLKVVLAYSGGLDTSIILKWLQTEYDAEVVTFTADLGQGEEVEPARRKAEMLGVDPENIFIEDLREEFVRDFVFPMFRANTVYEGDYLLGTSIARPLIAKRQIEIARKVGADAVCHGATGKGNDQVRFELGYYALEPDIRVIAPWREWQFQSREALIDFAEKHQIPIAKDKRGDAPFSIDANLLHSSSEGKVLEDPAAEAPEYVHQRTISPEDAPDKATTITIDFERGDPVAIDGKRLSPAALLTKLNQLGHDNGIGRLDLVENRFVGMKSRGVYETPGGTILLAAHRGIESITLDGGAMHLKDELMPRYASLIYNGFWFAPEREMLQAAIDKSQEHVSGRVRMKLYKGNVTVIGRESAETIYDQDLVTFEEGSGNYDHRDAAGFIRLNALRLRTLAQRQRRLKP